MDTAHPRQAGTKADPRTRFVGRAPELARLREAVATAAGGDSAAVVLLGPPGVGKTRLAHEALKMAATAGFATLAGRCDIVNRDGAFTPLVQAFGPALRSMTQPRLLRLASDLPQLALLIGGLGIDPPAPLGDPALERARLAEGFTRLLARLAGEQPVALLIDDAHAADDGTATLLQQIGSGALDRPVVLVCTVRSDDLAAGRVLAGLTDPSLKVEYLRLGPLPPSEAAELAGAVLGAPLDEPLAAVIADRCSGRPLLIHAVARTLAESSAVHIHDGRLGLRPGADVPLPPGVQAQLRARLAAADADERLLLRVLAVAGEADLDVLIRAVGLPQKRALTAMDRLHQRGVLEATSPPALCRFAHGLLRETALAELSPAATRGAHAALVGALGSGSGERMSIAEHVLAAGSLVAADQAIGHLRAGASRAQQIGLATTSARYLAAAADIARAGASREVLLGVLIELATVCQHLGEVQRAESVWSEVAVGFAEAGDPLGAARASRELAMLAWARGDLAGAGDRLDAAEQILQGLEPSREHARLLHARVVTAVRLGDVDAIRSATTRLGDIAARLGLPSAAARAHLAEGALRYAETDYAAATAADRRGLAAALEGDEPLLVLRAYDQLAVAAAAQLDVAGLREHSLASADLAGKLGSLSLAGWPRGRLAIAALLGGDWDAALRGISELAATVTATGERRGQVSVLAMRAWILTRHGRMADARQVLDQVDQIAGEELRADRNIFLIVALAEAIWALAADDPVRALEQRAAVEDLASGWLPLLALSEVGQAVIRCGDTEGGRGIAKRLRSVRSCITGAPDVLADWLDGLADCRGGCRAAGVPRLRTAASGFERLGMPFYAALAGLAAARADGDRARAVEQGRRSLAVFERLGAAQQAESARSLLRSHGLTPSRGRARRRTGTRLSARELEVACLVASGLSNADVATRLYISPRTVSTHLERIYGKLELTSRVALTRYLVDSGLLPPTIAGQP